MRKWREESKLELQYWLGSIEWSIFKTVATTLMSSLSLGPRLTAFVRTCVQTKIFCTYNNNKPWFTPIVRKLPQGREEVYTSKDRVLYKQLRNRICREIVAAKTSYSE